MHRAVLIALISTVSNQTLVTQQGSDHFFLYHFLPDRRMRMCVGVALFRACRLLWCVWKSFDWRCGHTRHTGETHCMLTSFTACFFFFHVYLGYTVRKWTLNCTSPYCWGGTFLYLVYLLPGKVHKIYPLKLYSKNCDFKGTLYLLYFLVKYNILKPHKH